MSIDQGVARRHPGHRKTVPPGRPRRDLEAAEDAVRRLLLALGADLDDQHLRDTPRRVARMYDEFLSPREFVPTMFDNVERHDDLVIVRDVEFTSLCAHHLLPFEGLVHVGYVPGEVIAGLSKLARIVDGVARRPQVQERLTLQVAERVEAQFAARGVGVVVTAAHHCMRRRGVAQARSSVTSCDFRGALRDDPDLRREFLALLSAGSGGNGAHGRRAG